MDMLGADFLSLGQDLLASFYPTTFTIQEKSTAPLLGPFVGVLNEISSAPAVASGALVYNAHAVIEAKKTQFASKPQSPAVVAVNGRSFVLSEIIEDETTYRLLLKNK